MNKTILALLVSLMVVQPAFAADASVSPQPKELGELLQKNQTVDAASEAKIKAVREEAMVLGGIGGFVYECKIITQKLNSRSLELTRIYNFQSLLTSNGVMLPVIEEARDKVTIEEQTITSAGGIYRIVKPARFVRIAPTYRDYLLSGLNCEKEEKKEAVFSFQLKSVSPQAWDEGVKLGWETGRERARITLEDNLAKLNRDYLGMIKFRRLEMLGAIQMPVIAQAKFNARIAPNKIETGVRSMTIEKQSKFVFDANHWKPEIGINNEDSNGQQDASTEEDSQ
jgi:defect-in-organelle-trafficking protein DotC